MEQYIVLLREALQKYNRVIKVYFQQKGYSNIIKVTIFNNFIQEKEILNKKVSNFGLSRNK